MGPFAPSTDGAASTFSGDKKRHYRHMSGANLQHVLLLQLLHLAVSGLTASTGHSGSQNPASPTTTCTAPRLLQGGAEWGSAMRRHLRMSDSGQSERALTVNETGRHLPALEGRPVPGSAQCAEDGA
jgi:hypothetical protein